MLQTEISVQKRGISNRSRKRRQRRICRWVCYLSVIAVFLFAAVLWNAEEKQVDLLPINDHEQNEPISNDPGQTVPDASTPIASGTWKLMLVNQLNPLPKDYSIKTVTLKNGLLVDSRCYPDLQAMMDACRAAGLSPVICSAYRSWEYQERLFKKKVNALIAQGYSEADAAKEAGKVVAVPGTSEHQTGLAVDIVDINYQLLDENQERTEVQKWLLEHSWEYGFVLRYPSEKSDITGIIYEPWHYRYVGREDAERMHTLGVCLEEYLQGAN